MKKKINTRTLTQLGILIAIIVLMAFTPLGYFRTGGLSITFIMVPVVIGAILLGPTSGAILGGVFGLTSFIQCFGLEPFGATLLNVNPFLCFVVCLVPRILTGLLCGLVFKALSKTDKTKFVSFGVASLAGPLLNTVLFMSALVACFYNTEFIQGIANGMGATNVFNFVVLFVGINGVIEAVVCFILGTAISKPLDSITKKLNKATA